MIITSPWRIGRPFRRRWFRWCRSKRTTADLSLSSARTHWESSSKNQVTPSPRRSMENRGGSHCSCGSSFCSSRSNFARPTFWTWVWPAITSSSRFSCPSMSISRARATEIRMRQTSSWCLSLNLPSRVGQQRSSRSKHHRSFALCSSPLFHFP